MADSAALWDSEAQARQEAWRQTQPQGEREGALAAWAEGWAWSLLYPSRDLPPLPRAQGRLRG